MTYKRNRLKKGGISDEEQRIADRYMLERFRAEEYRKRYGGFDSSTNWNGVGTVRNSQPFMFGEGLGNCLGLEGPKYTQGLCEESGVSEEETAIRRVQAVEKSKITRERNRGIQKRIRKAEKDGRYLFGRRIFLCVWTNDSWEEKAAVRGMPEEVVDLALTEYGILLMVRVFEEREGKAKGLTVPLRDKVGRKFYLPLSRREHIESVFGRVNWKPLTEVEARQFGVDF